MNPTLILAVFLFCVFAFVAFIAWGWLYVLIAWIDVNRPNPDVQKTDNFGG